MEITKKALELLTMDKETMSIDIIWERRNVKYNIMIIGLSCGKINHYVHKTGRNNKNFEIRQGMVVADFGSGSGHYVLAVAKK